MTEAVKQFKIVEMSISHIKQSHLELFDQITTNVGPPVIQSRDYRPLDVVNTASVGNNVINGQFISR